ncbi:TIGR02588 family protein [Kovacikia minuta CCNUW1]|uniref:TIGR02588 family protein n=1 Tax=Kovacikia minuta TaxID=2931930 RepID=UPI001CD03EEB|nr:TIGR02588 family protein [Kovacikia minuta]UBF28173.1 TIGR02588 family protein [Kovacikia minuta CCNUW1]
MSQAQEQESSDQQTKHPPRSFAEWITFSIASLILVVIAGLIIYTWVIERDRPPVLVIQRDGSVRQEGNQFYVPFEIANTGGETVDAVQVIAELRINGQVKESGEVQFDFLSGDEKEKGAFIFEQDPRQGELTIRIASYREP